jgi:hypothetical protein
MACALVSTIISCSRNEEKVLKETATKCPEIEE